MMMTLYLTRKSYSKALCAVAAGMVLLALSACEHPVGVFASLEEEIPVDEDRGVPTDDFMRSMLISGGGEGDYYFAEFTSLYVRRRTEDLDLSGEPRESWTRIRKPEAAREHDTLGSIAEYASELWAIYGGKLFTRPNDGSETGRGAWSERPAPDDISRVSRLFSVGDELLLSARMSGDGFSLYHRNGTGWGDPLGFDDVDDDRVNRINAIVEFDNHYYVATTSRIFRTSDLDTNFEPAEDGLPTAANYRELLEREIDGTPTLFAAGRKHISRTTDGENWTRSDPQSHDGEDVQFTSLGWYVAENGNAYLLAGTEKSGLYEAPDGNLDALRREGSGAGLLGRDGNFLTTRLSGGAVHNIFVDEEGRSWRSQDAPHIFVGAPGRGLWRGEHDQEYGVLTWRRE